VGTSERTERGEEERQNTRQTERMNQRTNPPIKSNRIDRSVERGWEGGRYRRERWQWCEQKDGKNTIPVSKRRFHSDRCHPFPGSRFGLSSIFWAFRIATSIVVMVHGQWHNRLLRAQPPHPSRPQIRGGPRTPAHNTCSTRMHNRSYNIAGNNIRIRYHPNRRHGTR